MWLLVHPTPSLAPWLAALAISQTLRLLLAMLWRRLLPCYLRLLLSWPLERRCLGKERIDFRLGFG